MRWIVFAFLALFFFFSCKKYDRVNPRDGIAGVTTSEAKQVNFSTVQISSSLTSVEGVSFISQRGVCWSTNPNPTVADAFTNEGSGFGTFVSTIEGLSANTTYYFRSFASNDKTIAYGNEVSFKIIAVLNIETKAATSIGFTSATIGGKLVSNGEYTIKTKGIFWGVYPGISEKSSIIAVDQTDFDYQLINLENSKTYYYRAFALTNEGYVFGEELNFTTLGYNSPSLTTNSITSIGVNSAVSGGVITSDGASPISAKGICWSTSSNPSTSDAKTNDGSGSDNFSSKLSGLQEGMTYYVRAYATNSKGTSYGNEVSFTTYALNKPILSTNTITNISSTTALSGGTISSDGGASITAKGVCWSTTSNPTIANNKTNEGTGASNFSSQLSGLQEGTIYYVRSYATNSKGTSYGNEVSFTTTAINKPTLTTNTITNISSTRATSGGVISSDGGASISAKGICWSTSNNPTVANSKTNEGTGVGSFTSQMTGLQEGAMYYVRAYATNSKGTSYGQEVSFTANEMLIDIEGNKYKTVNIGAQVWMAENLKTAKYSNGTVIPNVTDNSQWQNNTTGAWAYYNNDASNNIKYGKLYNWYVVSPTTNGNKNICPTGWHLPSDAEWTILIDYLGGETVAGGKMKEVGTTSWNSPNTKATNTSLFTGLPGGDRDYDGNYYHIGINACFWSSTENNANNAWVRLLETNDGYASRYYFGKRNGFSIRCIRD